MARTGKQPVAPTGAPQSGANKAAGGSGKRAAPKTTIIDQAWGDFVPSPAPAAPPPPPSEEEEVTAARKRAAILDMPIDDLDGVTNIFSGRDVARQVAAARSASSPASQPLIPPAPVTITGLPAPTPSAHTPAPAPVAPASHAPAPSAHAPVSHAPAPVSHAPAPAAHTPALTSAQPLRPKTGGPASVRPSAMPMSISTHPPAASQQAHAAPAQQPHAAPAHTPAPQQAAPAQQAAAPAHTVVAPATSTSAPMRVATVAAIRVAVFGREGDIRVLALAPQASAPPGTVTALLVPTSDADAAALGKLFGL